MRLQTALTVTALPLLASGLAACGGGADADEPKAFTVAEGVQQQYEVLAEELAEKGRSVDSGEWTVNLVTEAAEPWFEQQASGRTAYRAPQPGETNHIEIIPVETATGRIVPDVPITVDVVAQDGSVVQSMPLHFYYATFFHYAQNFSVPAGTYTLRVTLDAPTFNRHGAEDEQPALAQGATVEFDDVELGAE